MSTLLVVGLILLIVVLLGGWRAGGPQVGIGGAVGVLLILILLLFITGNVRLN